MTFAVAVTLLLLNCSFSDFFSNQNGTLSIEINQVQLPDRLFIDFGDGYVFNSRLNSTALNFSPENESSTITVLHTYKTDGRYDVYFNASNSFSSFEHWTSVVVEDKISGIELFLLSPPVVALLDEVIVTCLVETGTNLEFEWDFGDNSDGQFTLVDSFKTNSTAHHSYGIANSYNVSVHISNNYESITAYLNVTVQAVEPIEQLHLQPRIRGQYSAPLYKRKEDNDGDEPAYSTAPVEFEAWVWRGSDVEFLFDFGDGNTKFVSSLLNAWSLPYATVRHSYTAEGKYEVSVIATNLFSSLNESLEQPFYVQFPPENLVLDKKYYIIEYMSNLTLQASITQGTNVSYNWKIGDMYMRNTSNTLFLPLLNSGVYLVMVEAFNHVTDYGYGLVRRPNATAKIYVQKKLLGIHICINVDSHECCDFGSLDLPLDEEVQLRAKVIPSTETALRFIWQLGRDEIRRTNVPLLKHKFHQAGWYSINITAQNHISSASSLPVELNLIQKIANLNSVVCYGDNIVNHTITYRAFYWFGTNLTFQWDFGDGSNPVISTSSSIQHIYKEIGEYWVTVNVWNKFSHANITTNMFFLQHMCQKPKITFLHHRYRIARYDKDILLEANISVICKSINVKYLWTVKNSENQTINFHQADVLHQRQLVVPAGYLQPGNYNVYLKVNMIGTIVYTESSMTFEIVYPNPVIYIEGGFVRWIGINDTREMVAKTINVNNTNQALNYTWSCKPQIQQNLPCFQDANIQNHLSHYSAKFIVSSSELMPNLGAVIINVTIPSHKLISASQVLEIKQVPKMLRIDIECDDCHDHHVNQQNRIVMKVLCKNCGNSSIQYHWKIWMIDEGKFRMHFSNYDCVQADSSTFFIMAPNSTTDVHLLNATYLHHIDVLPSSLNTTDYHMLAEKPYDSTVEDLPPFPDLPGFPKEDNSSYQDFKLVRNARNAPIDPVFNSPDLILEAQYPFEGEALYEDNTTYQDFPYPDFMPFPPPGLSLGITDEGLPGEGGSASARQSSQNFGILLSEDENEILEGDGKPRMKSSGSTSISVHKHLPVGDPLRDALNRRPPMPHIVSRPRTSFSLTNAGTSTGFNSEYFIINPGILKIGRSYLIQAKVINTESGLEGFAMEYFKVNVGPVNGRCILMPTEGHSINFDFRLHCLEWKSEQFPLFYEISYSRRENDFGHLIYFGLNENVKFNLPSGFVSDDFNVYLNVIVRDNLGVATKVCSLIRRVKPLQMNMSLAHYIYNETFHPRTNLRKLIGEKHNQAVLQKLHVLTSSLNDEDFNLYENPDVPEVKLKIRQEFFEIINSIKISSKVEATQVFSVLNEMIEDVQTLNVFELQKAYNIYKHISMLRHTLWDFYAAEQMMNELLIFLSKLAFVSHTITPRNDELIEVAKEEFIEEIKDLLRTRLKIENPLKINIPHTNAAAFYVTKDLLSLKPLISLKKTSIQFLDNVDFMLKYSKERKRRCVTDSCKFDHECIIFIIQEYDYITRLHNHVTFEVPALTESSVLLSLKYCSEYTEEDDLPIKSLNLSIHFARSSSSMVDASIPLIESNMNIHAINVTEKDINYSLLFYAQLDYKNTTEKKVAIDVLFKSKNHPTMQNYDLKMSFPVSSSELNVFIPAEKLKVPGLYYFTILSSQVYGQKTSNEIILNYQVSIWRDACLGKSAGVWSRQDCYTLATSNSKSIHCRCSAVEISSFSYSYEWELLLVSINDIMDPYFNPLPLIALVILFVLYIILLCLNFQKDKMRNLCCSPVSLRDNEKKHKQFYLIRIETGMYFSSGTSASVFIVLHGTKDVTETRQLIGNSIKKFSFQKGSVDFFLLSTSKSLGPLLKVQIWHNNQGASPSWYLKTISIKDMHTDTNYCFNCYNWLSAEKGDGQIERELTIAEHPLKFNHVLYENILTHINDFSMWNAVVCNSPTSFFTGVQRLSCCLCFILNSAILFLVSQEIHSSEVTDEHTVPQVDHKTFLISLIIASVATIPQIFITALFRFSNRPTFNPNPKFSGFFHWLSFYNFNFWLKHKRSRSSHSTSHSESSVQGSDSLYSSFEDSSIMSVPDILDESFPPDIEDAVPLSFSCSDLSDPVSPLQKTLSTWQTLENWLKKKQDMILKPDIKRHSNLVKSNSIMLDERSSINNDLSDTLNGSSYVLQLSASSLTNASENSNNDDYESISPTCRELEFHNENLATCFHFPFFHSQFYYCAWFIVLINLITAFIYVILKTTRYTLTHNILLYKSILLSVVYSCLIISPFIIILIATANSIYVYIQTKKHLQEESDDYFSKETKPIKSDNSISSYRRIEYFKKYLRPPKEQVLEQFRRVVMHEKRICNFYGEVCQHVLVLILLLAMSFPEDTQMKFHQRESIQNALFQSIPKTTISLSSKDVLLNWLEVDFLDGFLAEHQCFYDDECGMSTKCIIVGSVILRHFHKTCSFLNSNVCQIFENTTQLPNFGDMYERRLLHGYYDSYFIESEWQVLSDGNFDVYDEIHSFMEKLNVSSTISLEFLLFNPTFTTLISVSFLFEAMETGAIRISNDIMPVVIYMENNGFHNLKIFTNFILFIFILFICKNQFWNMMKYRSLYWKQGWNIFSFVFIFAYFIYLIIYATYIITYKSTVTKLISTQLNSNINIIDLAVCELYVQYMNGTLVFIHLIKSLKIFHFNHRLKKMLNRLRNSQKVILFSFISFFIIVLISNVMIKSFIGVSSTFNHPLFGCIKVINSVLKDYGKPEIIYTNSISKNVLAIFTSLILIFIHFTLFSIIRSVLLNFKHLNNSTENKRILLKETGNIIKKKFLSSFHPKIPETMYIQEQVPPIDFLLLELERLADALVEKADTLFPEKSDKITDIESYLKSECELQLKRASKLKLSEVEFLNNAFEEYNVQVENHSTNKPYERLISTMPRETKVKINITPASFHSSLGSERRYNVNDSSFMLHQNRIRKTYPLSQLDSDSSSSSKNSPEHERRGTANALSIRKTKSCGKGKNENFDLNIINLDFESQ